VGSNPTWGAIPLHLMIGPADNVSEKKNGPKYPFFLWYTATGFPKDYRGFMVPFRDFGSTFSIGRTEPSTELHSTGNDRSSGASLPECQ
jgi:hypothetical protein